LEANNLRSILRVVASSELPEYGAKGFRLKTDAQGGTTLIAVENMKLLSRREVVLNPGEGPQSMQPDVADFRRKVVQARFLQISRNHVRIVFQQANVWNTAFR
jgi:hypothetical protein